MAKTFKQLTENSGDPKTVLVVDALNLAFRYKSRAKVKNAPIPPQESFMEDYVGVVESLARSYNAGKVIIAQDHGASKYRLELSPEYKEARRTKYAEASEEENQAFFDFLKYFNETIEYIETKRPQWLSLKYPGVEADDIAAFITNKSKPLGVKVWLISSDKDWKLLVAPNVSQFSTITRKEYTYDNWYDHHDHSIDDYISIKCLQGDAGDSVKGIAGIGPKRAEDLVKKYGSAWDLYEALPIDSKYVYIKNLNASKEIIPLNYKLMDLRTFCEDAIGEHLPDLQKRLEDFINDNPH